MQILSLLTEIGESLIKQSVSDMGPTWDISRMVNYHHGLGRMTLTPPAGAEATQMRGTIFLQTYRLTDGSVCLKANCSWQGCDHSLPITVYSKPGLKWRAEAAKIATAWLSGPPAPNVTVAQLGESAHDFDFAQIAAEAGR